MTGSPWGRMLRGAVYCLFLAACGGSKEKPIEYIYLAFGASDATGVGAVPLTEGYVYLIARELDRGCMACSWSISASPARASI